MNNDTLRKEIVDGWRDMIRNGTMTQEQWDKITPRAREEIRDNSGMAPLLIGLEGYRVEVTYTAESMNDRLGCNSLYPVRFIVGKTTGWRPCHLALRNRNQRGSSVTMDEKTPLKSVRKIERVR